MNKANLCLRCVELNHQEVLGDFLCTVEQKITKRIRDVSLCESCMKYMKKMNLVIKVYEEYDDEED